MLDKGLSKGAGQLTKVVKMGFDAGAGAAIPKSAGEAEGLILWGFDSWGHCKNSVCDILVDDGMSGHV
jgi:hypothetical protein